MNGWLGAGILYFALVFVAGFILGTLRVFILAPHLGPVAATSVELPAMLGISWLACGFAIDRMSVPAALRIRAAMGLFAFILLMIAELCLAVFGFGRSLAEHVQSYRAVDALLGLAGQLLFTVFPVVQIYRRR